jgi:hypothetical protein
MERLLNVTAIASGVLLIMILVSVRRAHIRPEYSVSWLVAAGAMLVFSRLQPVLNAAGRALGIPDSPVALLMIAAGVFLLMFYRFSMIVSRLKDNNIALAQRVAILEYHIEILRQGEPDRPAA